MTGSYGRSYAPPPTTRGRPRPPALPAGVGAAPTRADGSERVGSRGGARVGGVGRPGVAGRGGAGGERSSGTWGFCGGRGPGFGFGVGGRGEAPTAASGPHRARGVPGRTGRGVGSRGGGVRPGARRGGRVLRGPGGPCAAGSRAPIGSDRRGSGGAGVGAGRVRDRSDRSHRRVGRRSVADLGGVGS